ncbi:hypothetical protein SUGI_1071970 [Cryptomeria japonica]|uniref:BTB/POZ domain-containing protein At1g63850 n=1 Tax=Cryptomeria japonica TaxID=3369 RepID=UPI002414B8C6|nr:BTB/POZ domain-containing protein At1g63850 [Cryptomeria japonica]GLJ50314.1 hypothetical protein SUGI_1071970 [Cryptomeria japonica]
MFFKLSGSIYRRSSCGRLNSSLPSLKLQSAMDAQSFQIGDENDGDVILRLICSDGVEYEGNPVHLHSRVLNKSNFFQARLSERWSLHISPPEIKLTVLPNGVADNYIKCISLMYSSYKGTGIYFSGIDEALDIFPVASELLFEEGIQACMHYLEALPWTPQETLKIKSLLLSSHISVSADLSARLLISNSSFSEELELLKKKLPEMFSTIWKNQSHMIPLKSMRLTMEKKLSGIFQGNAFPAVQEVCRDAIINECSAKIKCIKNRRNDHNTGDSACENLLWLIDLTKLCNIRIFETTLKLFVEDTQLLDILLHESTDIYRSRRFSESFTEHLLQILVVRFMKGLTNGDVIASKSFRISFLRIWVPVMAYHICNLVSFSYSETIRGGWPQEYSERFVEDVTKVVGTLPLDDQKALFVFWTNSLQTFQTRWKEAFQWWIDAILLAVTSVNSNSLGTG